MDMGHKWLVTDFFQVEKVEVIKEVGKIAQIRHVGTDVGYVVNKEFLKESLEDAKTHLDVILNKKMKSVTEDFLNKINNAESLYDRALERISEFETENSNGL